MTTHEYLKDLYLQNRSIKEINRVDIPIEVELRVMREVALANQEHPTKFISGILEYYQENQFLSERQWFYVISNWLDLQRKAVK